MLKKQSVSLQSNATSEKNASIIQIRFVTEKTPWCIIPLWFVGTNSQTDYRHLVSRNLPGGQERAHRLHCSVENSGSITRGVLNFGLGRGVPLGILKCHHPSPIHVPILKEKWPIHVPRYMRSGPSMYRGVQFLTTHTCTCWKNSPMKVPE